MRHNHAVIYSYSNSYEDELGIYPAAKGFVGGLCNFKTRIGFDTMLQALSVAESNDVANRVEIITWHWTRVAQRLCHPQLLNQENSEGDVNITVSIRRDVRYVLIIEKEGVFRRLIESKFYEYVYETLSCHLTVFQASPVHYAHWLRFDYLSTAIP